MICALTGMEVSNASVYDGSTAAAEALAMCRERKRNTAYVSACADPQTIAVMRAYCFGSGMELEVIPERDGRTDLEALKTALGADGVDVAALTPDRVDRMKVVFWDMCEITTSVETIGHPASGTVEAWTEKILHITVTARTADEMRTVYFFTPEQNRALTELLAELNGIGTLLGDLGITQEDAAELLRRLPEDLSPERRAVVETACKLVGKVNYFWGGKSLVLGWDSRWGTIQKVWAAGSPSTGTYRPYGMDCSGFVDWVFYNMSGGSYVIGHGGGARMQHSYCTPISWTQAQPGDLVFYPEDTHVGIVGGWDESGNIQIIHCASGQNNVVITGKAGFTSIGRPDYYG